MTDPTAAPSADPEELRRFAALADRWWDPVGPFWPLHTLNRLRAGWLGERLPTLLGLVNGGELPLAGVRLLDIGCGGGILAESMARLGAAVTGIDVVERNVHVARRHAAAADLQIDYRAVSVESLAAAGERYDAVLNMEVVEHVAEFAPFVDACTAVVRPGGVMAVATINRTLLSWLVAIVGAEVVLRWLPRGTHRWAKFPTPAEVEAALAANGLGVVERTGVRVNPFTRAMRTVPSLAVNYMLLARRQA